VRCRSVLRDRLRPLHPAGLRREFTKANIPAAIEGFGNVLACLCTIYGLTIQDVSNQELDLIDPRFPITVCARAVKPTG